MLLAYKTNSSRRDLYTVYRYMFSKQNPFRRPIPFYSHTFRVNIASDICQWLKTDNACSHSCFLMISLQQRKCTKYLLYFFFFIKYHIRHKTLIGSLGRNYPFPPIVYFGNKLERISELINKKGFSKSHSRVPLADFFSTS